MIIMATVGLNHCISGRKWIVVLKITYSVWETNYYEQTGGVAMGSSVSAVIASFNMEFFEKEVL